MSVQHDLAALTLTNDGNRNALAALPKALFFFSLLSTKEEKRSTKTSP